MYLVLYALFLRTFVQFTEMSVSSTLNQYFFICGTQRDNVFYSHKTQIYAVLKMQSSTYA